MKITRHMLSIPPHISTSWNNISALHVTADHVLVITLTNQSIIKIPGLSSETIEQIFLMHTKFLETSAEQTLSQETTNRPGKPPFAFGTESSLTFGFPVKLGEGNEMLGSLGGLLQHSPEQAHAPSLPPEMLKKVAAISKAMGLDKQLEHMPKAEPHCNCPYCQVARALHEEPVESRPQAPIDETPIADDELTFREWDIREIGPQLYEVINPLDNVEKYQVFLGKPIGCTCGHKHCEHIKAVLSS